MFIKQALLRAAQPYRPNTMSRYRRQFHLYLCFAIRSQVSCVLSVSTLIGFLELLHACKVSPRSMANYVSGIKAVISLYGLPVGWMENKLISNYMRALFIHTPHVRKQRDVLSLQDIYNVSRALEGFDNPNQYRVAFLLSFYAFLRISNLVPPTQGAFDISRQLTRSDISWCPQGAKVYLKWAKNMQRVDQNHTVVIPTMSNYWLCPVRALTALFAQEGHRPHDPVIKKGAFTFTESHLRRRLALILKLLSLPHQSLTYHSLRRSGASMAFNNNVTMDGIRSQGAWSSDSVWEYLFAQSSRVNEVPQMFQRLEHSLSFGA